MRRVVPFTGSEADLFMSPVAKRFIPGSSTAAQIDRPGLIGFAGSIYPMTAGPQKLYVTGNHVRPVDSRGYANFHFLLLCTRDGMPYKTCTHILDYSGNVLLG